MSIANALWAEKTYQFLPDYKNIIQQYYGGNTTNLDFIKSAENSRNTINKWVEGKTNNKITNLMPKGSIDSSTRLVLTNAIYFKDKWYSPFEKNLTKDQVLQLFKDVEQGATAAGGNRTGLGKAKDATTQAIGSVQKMLAGARQWVKERPKRQSL